MPETLVRRGRRAENLEPAGDGRAEKNRLLAELRQERVERYQAFVAQNGGRLGEDLAGILDGSRQPSGEPAPECALPVRQYERLLAREPCMRCGQRRYRKIDPASDDGLCGGCRAKGRRGGAKARRCENCGKGRSTHARDGLCAKCRRNQGGDNGETDRRMGGVATL